MKKKTVKKNVMFSALIAVCALSSGMVLQAEKVSADTAKADALAITSGASIRVDSAETTGIRYKATVKAALADALITEEGAYEGNAEVGIFIVPTTVFDAYQTQTTYTDYFAFFKGKYGKEKTDVAQTYGAKALSETQDTDIYCSIVQLQDVNYNTAYKAVAYYVDKDGTYYYTNTSEERTVSSVANEALNDATGGYSDTQKGNMASIITKAVSLKNDGFTAKVVKNKTLDIKGAFAGEITAPDLAIAIKSGTCATVDTNGVLTATGVGEAVVNVSAYAGKLNFDVTVTCEDMPSYTLATKATVENQVGTIVLQDEIKGTVTSVTYNGIEVLSTYDETTKVITLDKTKLPTKASELGANKQFTITTDEAYYTLNADLYTLVINTAEELDEMGTIAYAQAADAKAWDGYFVLGNDIEYNKTFATFTNYTTAGKPAIAQVNETIGFIGTFDGRGYAIDGLATDYDSTQEYAGGVFGILNGTVKNVSFTNATHNNPFGFVSAIGTGNIENVYVHCKSVTATGEGGIFFGRCVAPKNGYKVKNCFANLENVACANVKIAYDWANPNFKVCQNVFGIGTTNYCIQDGKLYTNETYANTSVSNVGAYATYADFVSANRATSAFDNDFWKLCNGLPYPEKLTPPTLEQREFTGGAIGNNTSIPVDLGMYEMVTVDDTAIALGITVSGNRLIIPNDTTLFGKSFEITVSSVFNPENAVGTATYSIINSKNIEVKETVSASLAAYALNEGAYTVGKANTFVIDLSAYLTEDITGTIVSAKVGNNNFATPTLVDGKKISLDTASLGTSYGDRTVTVIIHDTDENENLVKVTTVTANIVVATLVINTANDLDAMGAVAYAQTADTKAWDGYFALGGNIAYNKTFVSFTDFVTAGAPPVAQVGKTIGFIGTFDGRGYAIDGLATDTAKNGGVFGILNGTVKNVSFINATHNNNQGFVSALGSGYIENVYVHCKSVTAEGGIFFGRYAMAVNGYNVKDCFVKLENVDCTNVKITYDWANTNFKVCQNVFGIGTTNYCIQDNKLYTNETYANTSASNVGAYATASDLLADVNSADSTINLNAFQATASSFWTIGTDGLPIPQKLVK